MFKTKDGHTIVIGDWIEDTSGVYEVTEFYENERKVIVNTVIFDDDISDSYTLGDWLILNKNEVAHYKWV